MPGGLPLATASRRQSLQGKHACEERKRNLQDLLENSGVVTRHGAIWQTLVGPGEQFESRGDYVAAKKAYTQSIETVAAPTCELSSAFSPFFCLSNISFVRRQLSGLDDDLYPD